MGAREDGAGWMLANGVSFADGGLASCRRNTASSFAASSAYFSRALGGNARNAFVAAANTGAVLLLDAYGGAVDDVPAGATAFVHRDARFSVQLLSYAAAATARARVRAARSRIAPFGNGQAYQNYPDPTLPDPPQAYYGANLPRLRSIKAAVDPEGRFPRSFAG